MRKPYIAVVGAVNVDICGRSFAPLLARDSNPGSVRTSFGGVGRNVAHNLRRLGVSVQLLTALGADDSARRIEEDCRAAGIGLDHALRVSDGVTSTYLYITDPDGNMELAVCDADIASLLTPVCLEARLDVLDGAALVVFDGNLTEETIDFLTSRCRAPLFADPVSAAKAGKLVPFLGRIHTLKPNALEAKLLTGQSDPRLAAQALVARGVRRAFVSDGKNGVFAADAKQSLRVPCYPAQVVDTTGCGDAAMAALCKCFLSGFSLADTARYAAAAGAIATECGGAVSHELSDAEIRKRIHGSEKNPHETVS